MPATLPGYVTGVTYNAMGQPVTRTNSNGTTTTYTYSATLSRLNTLVTTAGATTLQNLGYTWDATGQMLEQGRYVHGRKIGVWTRWHPNGQKALEGNYVDGVEDGPFTHWDDSGTITKVESYRDGHLLDDAVIDAPLRCRVEHRPAVDQPAATCEGHALVEHLAVARARKHEPGAPHGRVVDGGIRVAAPQHNRTVRAQIDAFRIGQCAGQQAGIAIRRDEHVSVRHLRRSLRGEEAGGIVEREAVPLVAVGGERALLLLRRARFRREAEKARD